MIYFFEHHGMEGKQLFRISRMPNAVFPAHLHRAYELIFIRSGVLTLHVEQKQYSLCSGDLAFIFCNQIHSFSTADHSDIMIILFSPEMIGDFYSVYKEHIPHCNVIHMNRTLDFESMQSIYAQKSFLYEICDRLLQSTRMEPTSNQSQIALLQKVFAYVDVHFHQACSLKTVAAALQYDYAYLSKLFARLAGMHYTEYLNDYRIAQACYLLTAGRHTISDIASLCGYQTLRTFHRNFRLVMHCSPREYLSKVLSQKAMENSEIIGALF